ncbi:MAG: DNRLRE domain-containing protein, partial [Phycisphaerales bacterium]
MSNLLSSGPEVAQSFVAPCTSRRHQAGPFAAFAGLLGAALALFAPSAASAQVTMDFGAFRDGTMYEDTQGDVANGAGAHMFVGLTGGTVQAGGPSGFRRRALVRFNLSAIPAGSVINSVTLTLYMSRTSQEINNTIGVHKLLADWGEGTSNAVDNEGRAAPATTNDVTWQHRFYSGTTWTNAGGTGQFTASASDTTPVGAPNNAYVWTSAGMATDVTGWVNTPSTNFGWLLRGNETDANLTKRFNTKEHATSAQRPKLTVTFTPPTGACCEDGVCTILSAAACTSSGGVYQGNNTVCSPNPCPPPTGACCTAGVCTVQTEANCTGGGGVYIGNNTDCSPDPCAAGTTVTFTPDRDNTLYETTDGSLSNGSGVYMIVGTGAATNQRRRAVVHFNVASIPANATITAATLRIYLFASFAGSAQTTVVQKLTSSWGEGTSNAGGDETSGATSTSNDATWIDRFFPSTNWNTNGGDFSAFTVSANINVGPATGFYDFAAPQLTADVQSWVGNAANNHGWVVKRALFSESTINTMLQFGSRNGIFPNFRPQLVLTYTTPPPTGACCDVLGGCTVLTQANCDASGGVYNGDNTVCSPNPCPQPVGACCFNSGTCSALTEVTCGNLGGTSQGHFTECMNAVCPLVRTPFVDTLPIPPLAQPVSGVPGGAANYIIDITEFNHQFHTDLPLTRVWGYDGSVPGPTFEATRGNPITVTWLNDLRSQPGNILRNSHILPIDTCLHGPDVTGRAPVTVIHFHGGKVDPTSDGSPDETFAPGQSSVPYYYPNDQRACTMWYHDHALGITRLNVMMGLAGAYILRDNLENALGLPSGEFEIPLIIQDKSFNPDGSIKYNPQFQDHFFGQFAVVNGKVWPRLEVKLGKYRFRMVNGSNTRFYTLALAGSQPFQQIGTDQGLLPAPVTVTSVTLGPGERADVVIDFATIFNATSRGIGLVNLAPAPFPDGQPENDLPLIMAFLLAPNQPGFTAPLPASLVPVPPIPEAESVVSREFTLRNVGDPECNHGLWLINDLMWDDITDFPRIGTTETWTFTNRSGLTHPMHIHLVSFQILDRQNFTVVNNVPTPSGPRVPPPPAEAGWKDTVLAHPNQFTRVIMRFEGFSGLYPMHCHILEHEDHEMMRLFDVVCDPPIVTMQPVDVTVPLGGSVNFSTTATGDVLQYEWYSNIGALTDGPTPWGSTRAGVTTP